MNTQKTITVAQAAVLCQTVEHDLLETYANNQKDAPSSSDLLDFRPGDPWQGARQKFSYEDILTIELARQLHDDRGLPLADAFKIVSYTGAVRHFLSRDDRLPIVDSPMKTLHDFWAAIVAARATWTGPRGDGWHTTFGPDECWHTMHFTGTFKTVTAEIESWMLYDEKEWPDSDPARIFFVNVSAADRRLRTRAKAFNIALT